MLKKVCTNRLLSLQPWTRRLIFLPGVPSWRKVPGVSRSFGSCTDAVHLNGVIVEKVDRCVVLHMERGENRVNREFVNVMNQAFDLAERYIQNLLSHTHRLVRPILCMCVQYMYKMYVFGLKGGGW